MTVFKVRKRPSFSLMGYAESKILDPWLPHTPKKGDVQCDMKGECKQLTDGDGLLSSSVTSPPHFAVLPHSIRCVCKREMGMAALES